MGLHHLGQDREEGLRRKKRRGREHCCSESEERTPSAQPSVGPRPAHRLQPDALGVDSQIQACERISSSRICHAPLPRGLPAAAWLCKIRSSSSTTRISASSVTVKTTNKKPHQFQVPVTRWAGAALRVIQQQLVKGWGEQLRSSPFVPTFNLRCL